MNKDILKNKTVIQFLKFGAVGLSNTLIHYVVFLLCISLSFHYLAANALGFIISVTNAFYWNNKYVFAAEGKAKRNIFAAYVKMVLAYALTGIVLNSFLLYIFIDKLNIPGYLAQIIILCITVPLNFVINKFWSFKKRENEKEDKCIDSLL